MFLLGRLATYITMAIDTSWSIRSLDHVNVVPTLHSDVLGMLMIINILRPYLIFCIQLCTPHDNIHTLHIELTS